MDVFVKIQRGYKFCTEEVYSLRCGTSETFHWVTDTWKTFKSTWGGIIYVLRIREGKQKKDSHLDSVSEVSNVHYTDDPPKK